MTIKKQLHCSKTHRKGFDMNCPDCVAYAIENIKIGQRVRSLVDATPGVVEDVDYACIRIRWEDGQYGIFLKKEGFKMFVPCDLSDIEGASDATER